MTDSDKVALVRLLGEAQDELFPEGKPVRELFYEFNRVRLAIVDSVDDVDAFYAELEPAV